MGSSDPLPAGFEIRFGSLNFQATGNGYLRASPTVPSSIRGGRLDRDRLPPRLLLASWNPCRRALRALQHLDADTVLVNAHARCERNGARPCASRHDVTHPSTKR
jgi:hypothetical protein